MTAPSSWSLTSLVHTLAPGILCCCAGASQGFPDEWNRFYLFFLILIYLFFPKVFSVTMKRLKATDIDQEVKERAISCMGHIVCHLGDHLRAEVQAVLAIFLERLKNEITRLTAVRTITLIAASPLKVYYDFRFVFLI